MASTESTRPPSPVLRMATAPLALPSGMRDMLPPRSIHRRAVARGLLEAFGRYGYELVVPPVFEREAVVARGLGARVGGDLVRLLDPDTGEVLVLRPDMTPQIARIVATRYGDVPSPIRLAYEGSVIRRPRGRARRHRQVAQAGIECVGWGALDADLEVITVVAQALAGTGAFQIELSHAGLAGAALAAVPAALRDDVADALATRDETTWTRLLHGTPDAARTLTAIAAVAGGRDRLALADTLLPGPAWAQGLAELRAVAEGLSAAGLGDRVLVDLGEVRGLGYYTGLQFQVLVPGVSEPVASGGRYDELLGRYGAPRPATGCAIDLEALEDALALQQLPADRTADPRTVVAGTATARRAHAQTLRTTGEVVAELDTTDPRETVGWARAHGYSRAVLCTDHGVRVLEVPAG